MYEFIASIFISLKLHVTLEFCISICNNYFSQDAKLSYILFSKIPEPCYLSHFPLLITIGISVCAFVQYFCKKRNYNHMRCT